MRKKTKEIMGWDELASSSCDQTAYHTHFMLNYS